MKSLRIYLAGPISGRSYEEVTKSIQEKTYYLSDFGYDVLHPMTAKGGLRNIRDFGSTDKSYPKLPVATNHAIFTRDMWMVRQSDVVLADLTRATQVSIGTMMELAWAALLGKYVVTIMEKDNPHRHAFTLEASSIVFENWPDARDYLKELIEGSM